MGAKGIAPGITPTEQVIILFQLQFEEDKRLKENSAKTFDALPINIAKPVASSELPKEVLDFCARRWLSKRDELVEVLVRNQHSDDMTIAFVASRCGDRLAEIIAENQVRLSRSPIIIEQLYQNPNAHQSVIDRVVEFAKRQDLALDGLPGLKHALKATTAEESKEPEPEAAPDDNIFAAILQDSIRQGIEEDVKGVTTAQIEAKVSEFADLLENAMQQSTGMDFGDFAENSASDDPSEEDEEGRVVNKQIMIQKMKISQKVRLATIGSRQDRALLVRDPNRIVHMAAVLSPKIQGRDLKDFAGNKEMPDNVINYIAGRREATRDYQMLLKLVNNPKLKLATGIRMINFMRANDLRSLSRSRNVSPKLAKAAKALLGKRKGT